MRVIFAGTPQAAVPTLDAIASSRHDLIAVVTRPDAARGRGRSVQPSPVASRAEAIAVPVLRPQSLREETFIEQLAELSPDCCPIVAFGGLVPPSALSIPSQGWVNLHFSLLPAWRGAAPVQHALLHGDEVTGATTFRLAEGLDTGPVYGSVTETVTTNDTSGGLLERLAAAGAELMVRTLDGIERGDLILHEQPDDGVSWAPKLTPDDARVRWSDPALACDRRIRACTPAPGAWTQHGSLRLGLLPLATGSADETGAAGTSLMPGEVRVGRRQVWVGTGSSSVLLGEVKPAGKGVMSAADWARGVRLIDGDRFT